MFIWIHLITFTVTSLSCLIVFYILNPFLLTFAVCLCFWKCLCTFNDGYIEETCKHWLHSHLDHISEQYRSIWPFWPYMFTFKWKHALLWRNTSLLAGNFYAFSNLAHVIWLVELVILFVQKFFFKGLYFLLFCTDTNLLMKFDQRRVLQNCQNLCFFFSNLLSVHEMHILLLTFLILCWWSTSQMLDFLAQSCKVLLITFYVRLIQILTG